MKTNNSSVEDINYHPKSTSDVEYSIRNNSSVKTDINIDIYFHNQGKLLANNGIHTDTKHTADFSKFIG